MFGTSNVSRLYKHLAKLQKKRGDCADYSSTPNRCQNVYTNRITSIQNKIRNMKRKETRAKNAQESVLDSYLNYIQEAGFETKPKGWTEKSVKKSASTLAKGMGLKSAKDKGFFDKCVKKMSKHMENPEGYCASLKDEAYDSTYWRGKDKPKKQALKMTRLHKNV